VARWRLSSLWRDSDDVGYGVLITLIAVTYVASVAFFSPVGVALVLLLQAFVLLVVLRVAHARKALLRAADLVLVLTVVVVVVGLAVRPDTAGRSPVLIALYVLSALLYGVAPISLLRHTLARPKIDLQTLVAAIASYAMLGMFFAFTYRATATIQTTPFFGSSGRGDMADDLFFSFITLTTTGYGNLVPATNPGQTFAVLEAIVGQLFLVTAVAKIVNESGLLSSSRFHADAEHMDAPTAAPSGSDPAAEPQAP
jgi:Ion channel